MPPPAPSFAPSFAPARALRPGRRLCLLLWALAAPGLAAAQSCSSDGRPRPLALLERFVNADCATCWSDPATPTAAARTLAIDWIVPGARGEEAPLSAAASRDGVARLKALGRPLPAQSAVVESRLLAAARTLRVAHGLPFNDYVAASIALRPAGSAPWSAWLALVETLPAGTEGSPVERHLVRNLFQPPWDQARTPTQGEQKKLMDTRPMRIPDGADPARLSMVGWVEDARGRIRAIAHSRCAPAATSR